MRGIRKQGTRAQRLARPGAPHGIAPLPGTMTTGGAASPDAVQVMPLAEVIVTPAVQPGYVTLGYRGLLPIWAPDGETIPARAPGRWGQLRAAGRI